MFHKLARTHLINLESKRYSISFDKGFDSFSYLNLNINSLSSGPYKTYPPLKDHSLAHDYIKTLRNLFYLSKESSLLNENHIFFTNGSTESIDLIIRTFCEPAKDAVIITPPTFSYYAYRALIENIEFINIPLLGENLNQLDIPNILKQKQAKVLFLCSPNNPVGTTLDPKEIKTIIRKFPGIVVVDEAYIEWTVAKSCIQWLADYENLIILRTFSKIWGLAGARAGVTISSPDIIDTLHFLQNMFSFPKSTADLVQEKMKEYKLVLSHKAQVKEQREQFYNFLIGLKITEKVYPGTANFLLAQFYDEKRVEKLLYDAKILVNNCSNQIPRALRISIGTPEEMECLEKVLNEVV